MRSADDRRRSLPKASGPVASHAFRAAAGGFGYDPVFLDASSGLSAAELSPEQKHASAIAARPWPSCAHAWPGDDPGFSHLWERLQPRQLLHYSPPADICGSGFSLCDSSALLWEWLQPRILHPIADRVRPTGHRDTKLQPQMMTPINPANIPLSLYVHLPWCVRKCPYCDFNCISAPAALPEDAYVDALIADLALEAPLALGRPLNRSSSGRHTQSVQRPWYRPHSLMPCARR